VSRAALALVPGGLVVWLSFNGGGFFAGEPALAAAALCVLLVLRVTVAREPGEGFGPPLLLAAGALALLAGWTLASGLWSDAPARALLEFDRALLYLLVLVYCGSFVRTREQVRWVVRGVAAAIVAVAGIGLVTHLLPELWPTAPNINPGRLSYPLTYWNALGLLTGLGFVLCFALSSQEQEHPLGRVLSAAALPVLGPVLVLTSSRGAIYTTAIGLVAYVLIARPRGFPAAFLATAPITAALMREANRASELHADPTSAAAIAEGQDLALLVGLGIVAAGLLRAALLRLDDRLAGVRATPAMRRLALPAVGAALVVTLVASVALDAAGRLSERYDEFVADTTVASESGGRLFSSGNNGRVRAWRVAWDGFEREPLTGSGAGTFQLEWARERPESYTQLDAHSLYAEVLGELGWPGLALLLATILAVLAGVARRARGPDRALYAGILAAGLTWALAAGVDWHWEMAAVTLPFFALGGAALASTRRRLPAPGRTARLLIAVGLLVLAVTPVRVAVSQARLNAAVDSFRAGDCQGAIDSALGASSALGARPEPYEILGWCDARLGQERLGEQMMRAAIRRDPENWELYYGLALVRGAGGRDPLPAARRALELNPLGELTNEAVRRFRTRDPSKWEERARSAELPLN
jgi:O-antigen ligase